MPGYPIAVGEVEAEVRAKNSTLYRLCAPAESVDDAKAFIAAMRERYPDARITVPLPPAMGRQLRMG